MMKELFESGAFLYIAAGFAGIGVLLRVTLALIYRRLVKASEQMGRTKNKWARQLKARFEACYQVGIGVKNVDIFVDKYVYKQKFCGVLLSTWELISSQMKYFCLIAASIGGITGLVTECGKNEIISTFCAGIWMAVLLIIVDNISAPVEKRELLCLNLKDYLENFLKVRCENPEEYEAIQKEYAYSSESEAPGRKERRQARKFAKQEKKRLNKEEKLQKKEEKRLLADEKKREEEAKALAELEEKKLAAQRKKEAAMERRRQQLIRMQGGDSEPEESPAQNGKKAEAKQPQSPSHSQNPLQNQAAAKADTAGIPEVENSAKSGKGSIIRLRKEDEPAMQTAAAKEAEDKLIADVLKEFLS